MTVPIATVDVISYICIFSFCCGHSVATVVKVANLKPIFRIGKVSTRIFIVYFKITSFVLTLSVFVQNVMGHVISILDNEYLARPIHEGS